MSRSTGPGLRVAVTGAAGYLGRTLAERCAVREVELLGVDVAPQPPGWPDGARFERRDVTAPGLDELFAAFRPDVVVHLAWVFDPLHDRARERRVDVGGTLATLRAAARAGARRIVYSSSTTAYGIQPGRTLPFREEDPPRPNPAYRYAYHKAQVEQWLPGFAAAHARVELVVLRPCIVVGPRARNLVTRIAEYPVMPRVAGYDPPVQFVHEEDLVEVLYRALRDAPPGTYNVAGDGVMRYSEVCRAAGRPCLALPAGLLAPVVAALWTLRLLPFPAGLLDYIRYPWVADNARLKAHFGYVPRHTTRDAFGAWVEARNVSGR